MQRAEELKNGVWVEINPILIKFGMIFRAIESTGTPVKGHYCIAESGAYYNKDGVVDIDMYVHNP